MSSFKFGNTSRKRMEGVHPDLVRVAERALSYGILDLTVVPYGGLRTLEDQKKLVARGASKTLNSLHRVQSTGYGHAIDLAPYPIDWNDIERFKMMMALMFRAAMEEDVYIRAGGMWPSFKDYPHFDLGRNF